MASPAAEKIATLLNDESDYGSDFSPEEEQIVSQLLSGPKVDIEDNPIVTAVESNAEDDSQQALRVPLFTGRAQRSPLYQAARAAEEVAENINKTVKRRRNYPDCKLPPKARAMILTDA